MRRAWLAALCLTACHPSAPPRPVDQSSIPSPAEAKLTTVSHPDLPLGRWMNLNPGNYMWVARLEPNQRYRVTADWKSQDGKVILDLAAVHIDSDAEWDESDVIKKIAVTAQLDGSLSGILELAPGANAGRIRLSRTGNGADPLLLRVEAF
jgi:hypothetical protein